jgi:hypothetical protein
VEETKLVKPTDKAIAFSTVAGHRTGEQPMSAVERGCGQTVVLVKL